MKRNRLLAGFVYGKWILNLIMQWDEALLFERSVTLIYSLSVFMRFWLFAAVWRSTDGCWMRLGHIVLQCHWPPLSVCVCVYMCLSAHVYVLLSALNQSKCESVVCMWLRVTDGVWVRGDEERCFFFLCVCSASTITSHLLCSALPAEDCQLLSQIPKVRCLRNGRREGEWRAGWDWGRMERRQIGLMEKMLFLKSLSYILN